jgi:tRNA G10  N-methylase Trm11
VSLALDSPAAVPSVWLTPRPCRTAPIHRWFVFPHSYAPQLVGWLVDRLALPSGAVVLDPFCGAGTTLVEAQRLGFRPVGLDLLPLAVLSSRAKTKVVRIEDLRSARRAVLRAVRAARSRTPPPPVLDRALSAETYGRLSAGLQACDRTSASDCLRLAVLSVARRASALVADGGWLRAAEPELSADALYDTVSGALDVVEQDSALIAGPRPLVEIGDARRLPVADSSVDAVITSPPYPNRHDYTRVFAVELELGFGLGAAIKDLRYRALRSHPEARPPQDALLYREPAPLTEQIEEVTAKHPDPRIPRMLRGYFQDLFEVLTEMRRVLVPGGSAALVVGNAQYCGVPVPVDEHLANAAEQADLTVDEIHPLRLRGNSAQQMGAYGRRASRESVVFLRRGGSSRR